MHIARARKKNTARKIATKLVWKNDSRNKFLTVSPKLIYCFFSPDGAFFSHLRFAPNPNSGRV